MSLEQSPIIIRGRMDSVALLQNMVRIPSHTTEVPLADYLTEVTAQHLPGFHARRLETTVSGRPSLIISNHERPDVVFISHYDTVEPWVKGGSELGKGMYDPFSGEIDEGRLFGVGAGDDKSGAATAIAAVHSLLDRSDLPRVGLVLTSMEERSMQGMQAVAGYFEQQIHENPGYFPQFGLSLNGADKQLGTGCRGALEIPFRFVGLTGHSAIRTPGMTLPISAVEEGFGLAMQLKNELLSAEPTALGHTTFNFTDPVGGLLNAEGGIDHGSANKVPDVLEGLFEFRPNDGLLNGEPINYDTLAKRIHEMAADRGITVARIANQLDMAAWLSDRAELGWLEKIIKDVNGVDEVPDWPAREHGYDEVAMFNQAIRKNGFNVPTAIYGVVIPGFFHGPDEHVVIEDLRGQEEIVRSILLDSQFKRTISSEPPLFPAGSPSWEYQHVQWRGN